MVELTGTKVLIVAKCNVNSVEKNAEKEKYFVLIVAKCNVNRTYLNFSANSLVVLIVAKCNVNFDEELWEKFIRTMY